MLFSLGAMLNDTITIKFFIQIMTSNHHIFVSTFVSCLIFVVSINYFPFVIYANLLKPPFGA